MTSLRYHLLGRSGLRVSELALGTMTFGTDWGWGADLEESRRILARFVEVGGNFVDTASNYTDGSSEEFVGELTHPDRDRFVLATKYTLSLDPTDPNAAKPNRGADLEPLNRFKKIRLHHRRFLEPFACSQDDNADDGERRRSRSLCDG